MKSSLHRLIPLTLLAAGLPLARADNCEFRAYRVALQPAAALPDDSPKDSDDGLGAAPPRRGPREMQTMTFLGVETSPISPTLTAQLGLPDETGLVVERVMPDSPAAAAIKPFDILLKLDDQWLIDPRQFAVLVHGHKAGDSVTLTYVRSGKQSTCAVKLAQHQAPKLASAAPGPSPFWQPFPEMGGNVEFGRPDADRMLRLMDEIDRGAGLQSMARAARAGSGPDLNEVEVDPANSNLLFSDDQGTLDLTIREGKQSLVAKDAQGKEIFSGPVTTPQERKALPASVASRLDKLESMNGVSFKTGDDFKANVRVLHPPGQGIRMLRIAPSETEVILSF